VRLLLDTHTLLWFHLGAPQLSTAARLLIEDAANTKLVSPANYWELAIKVGLGRYTLTESYDDFIQHSIFDNGFIILPVEPRHTVVLVTLPLHHKDPFDRLMIAQAMVEGIPLVSADPALDPYPIARHW
jgi:PIN domain nuclease of toxin-antitoxin system